MANHKSALKRARQSETRRLRNRMNKTRVKNAVKSVRVAVTGGDSAVATDALRCAMAALSKAASKGTLHQRNVARRISRLSKQVAAIQPSV
ncbi:MAG: 30S ribosomal protein S20 [Candidatus Adiutrix sp.]